MKKTLPPRAPKSASTVAAPIPAPSDKAAPKFTPRGAVKNRILVAVTDDKIDFQAMSPEASKKLNDLLHSPDVQAQFGIGPLTKKFDPDHCKRLYQALGKVFQSVARFGLRWPEVAVAQLTYSEKEQEELAGPTADVLDQFGSHWMQENQSVLALGLIFTAITQQKIQAAMYAIALSQKLDPRASPAGAVRSVTQRPIVENKASPAAAATEDLLGRE